MPEHNLTSSEAAKRLGVSRKRIQQLARAGRIGQKLGRDWIFTEAEIEAIKERPTGYPKGRGRSSAEPKTRRVKIKNNRHGTEITLNARIVSGEWHISDGQGAKAWQTLCGDRDCRALCGIIGERGPQEFDFLEALLGKKGFNLVREEKK